VEFRGSAALTIYLQHRLKRQRKLDAKKKKKDLRLFGVKLTRQYLTLNIPIISALAKNRWQTSGDKERRKMAEKSDRRSVTRKLRLKFQGRKKKKKPKKNKKKKKKKRKKNKNTTKKGSAKKTDEGGRIIHFHYTYFNYLRFKEQRTSLMRCATASGGDARIIYSDSKDSSIPVCRSRGYFKDGG